MSDDETVVLDEGDTLLLNQTDQQKQRSVSIDRNADNQENEELLGGSELPDLKELRLQQALRRKDYIRRVDALHYCIPCKKYADEHHLNADKHIKRVAWIASLDHPEKAEVIWKMHNGTVNWFAEKACEKKPKEARPHQAARGGMKAASEAASSSKEPSQPQAADPKIAHVKESSSSASSSRGDTCAVVCALRSSAAFACGGSDGQTDDHNDYGSDPLTPISDMSDAALATGLEEYATQSGFRRIWVKGAQAWLPIDANEYTQLSNLHVQAGITFCIHTDDVALFKDHVLLARNGSVADWDIQHCDEILLARKPYTEPPKKNRKQALPTLDPIEMFEDKPQDSEKYMEEIEAMAKLDQDVINVSIRSTRGTIVRQFYKGTLLSSITAWFARSKKVSAQRISAFTKSEDHSCIQDTDLAFYINQPNRGGASLWVRHNEEEWNEYDITQYTTVEDLKQMQGWQLYHLQYKGAQLDGAIRLVDLKSDCVDLTATLPPTWLRTRSSCLKSRILTLVELTEWFLPDQTVSPDMSAQDILQIAINQFNTAKAYHVLSIRREHHPMRGGGKQAGQGGRLVWESTRTITGLKLLTEVSAAGKAVPNICIDEVCRDTTGIAMSLINTWNARLQGIESKQPLLLLFPGRCKEVLLRLGAAQGRLSEMELVYIDETTQKIFKRQTTTLSLSDHAYQYGKDLQSVEWLPSASVEY